MGKSSHLARTIAMPETTNKAYKVISLRSRRAERPDPPDRQQRHPPARAVWLRLFRVRAHWTARYAPCAARLWPKRASQWYARQPSCRIPGADQEPRRRRDIRAVLEIGRAS